MARDYEISLKSGYTTKTLATINASDVKGIYSLYEDVAAGLHFVQATVEKLAESQRQQRTYTGYITNEAFDALNVSTVSIPESFAGLEAVDTPTRLQEQLFRIYDVEESEDYVTVHARHVWYDNLQNYTLWEPTEDTEYTAAAVCRNILTNAISDVESNVASDCTDTKPGSEFDYARKNIVEAFLDPENGVCAKFGLSLIRYNWDFYCLKNVGYDRGYVIQDKKNLLGVVRTESIENVVTRVAPIGMDKDGNVVWLDNDGSKYIDSQYISDYSHPRVEIYDTGLRIGQDDVTADNINEKLLAAGRARFSEDKVDLPEITMTINFLSIGDTEEYAQYRGLDKVYLYDIVTIKDTVRGYEYSAQVVGVEHDILTGMLTSVTLGKITNSDGIRKIAVWQVPEISGENIRLKTIMAGAFQPGAINADDLAAGAVNYIHLAAATIDNLKTESLEAVQANIETLIAGKVKADSIDATDLSAINAKLGTATITNGFIDNADISFANIKDASVENLIAHDAVTDRYFIDKLAVNNAQFVYATVNRLVIKTADGRYYRLNIDENGQLVPQEVTLSIGEINAGITEDGKASIVETDLTVTDLSASNMKAINALVAKLTADTIDVNQLFAREATIDWLNTADIRGNTYLHLALDNKANSYTQWVDPSLDEDVKEGDIWYKLLVPFVTHEDMSAYTHAQLSEYTVGGGENGTCYIWKNGEWVETAGDRYAVKSGISIEDEGVIISGGRFIKIVSGTTVKMLLDETGIDMRTPGKFSLHAEDASNSSIIFGTDKSNANFYVGQSGDLVCKSIVTDELSVNGNGFPRIVVSEKEPTGGNVVWVKPSSQSEKQFNFLPNSLVLDKVGGTLGYYKDFNCSYDADDYVSGDLFYGVFGKLYFYNLNTYSSRTFKALLKNGSSWIDLGSVTDFVQTGRTLKLDSLTASAMTNIMSEQGGAFTIRLETNAPSGECMLLRGESITIKVKNTSSSSLSACTVFYKG